MLVEIGLCTSFVESSPDENASQPAAVLPISELIHAKDYRKAAATIKATLVDIAASRLPNAMGSMYKEVVVSCLTCLDKNTEGLGGGTEPDDENGINVGVRYIEKATTPLSCLRR